MDGQTYAAAASVCACLAGRLSDEALGAVRDHYVGGEPELAESALLLGLAHEGVAITREEQDLIRATPDDPDNPDLDDVPLTDEPPDLVYRFHASGPAHAPDPTHADATLSAAAPHHGGRRLCRAWREPLPGAQNRATWLYVLTVSADADALAAFAGLTSRLWVALQVSWRLEVVVDGHDVPPYQAAAMAAAHEVWSA
jgi:hypothetical protein